MTDVTINGDGRTSNQLKGLPTMFINLVRGPKWKTKLNWLHKEGPERKADVTPDSSAVIASLDLEGVPEELKRGQRISVPLDCSIAPFGFWATLSISPQLAELFDASYAAYYPPGYKGTPEIGLVAKDAISKKDIPLVAAYIMLVS